MKRGGVSAGAAAATAAGLTVAGLTPWSGSPQVAAVDVAFVAGVTALAVLCDIARTDDGAALRISFFAQMAALLVLGPLAMTLVAIISAAGRFVLVPPRDHRLRRRVLDLAAVIAAAQAAALAYSQAAALPLPSGWPWTAIGIGAAIIAYTCVTTVAEDLLVPRVLGSPASTAWPSGAFRHLPAHVIAGALSVAAVAAAQNRAWALLAVAAAPLGFAWHALLRQTTIVGPAAVPDEPPADDLAHHAACVVDADGRITVWNDRLAMALGCPGERTLGRRLDDVTPGVASTGLTLAMTEVLANHAPRLLRRVPVRAGAGAQSFDIALLPRPAGALLLWTDVTAEHVTEQSLRHTAERFALIARGANDGVWELDETRQTLFLSSRWREIVGLPAEDTLSGHAEWFDRVHPDDLPALRSALARLADGADCLEHEHRIRHEDGSYRRVLCRCVVARDGERRVTRLAGSLTDVTESAMAREQILHAGSRDPLTSLFNRASFVERLASRLDDYKARRGGRFAVLYLDIDRFKVFNDSLGHQVGDELLTAVARRLEACLRPGDVIARLGGDEFAVLLQNITDEMQANVVAFRLQETLQASFAVGGREVVTSASIGIAICRTEHPDAEAMMRDADTAMHHAKSHGKARHEMFDVDRHAPAADRLGLESDLRRAVKGSCFEVHYQPIVSLTTRMIIGFESLVRWNRNGKPVSPADFIPVAEELGIIEPLGTWVMQQACQKFVEWKARYPQTPLDCITVNVSAKQLVQQGFVYLVEQTVEQNGMQPGDLRLEITETALMDAPQYVAQVLTELREYGVKIYLDDFGTGFSSLSHLHKLPVDALKIDRSFVRGLLLDDRPAIVESIIALARTLQTSVVAEGIEEEQQAVVLERLGCLRAQGFYFSRPVPADVVEHLLADGRPLGTSRIPPPQPARATLREPALARGVA